MGKLTLVTGGARSGKSAYAEELVNKIDGEILYIATAIPYDDEMKRRIEKHQQQRPSYWTTYEGYKDIGITMEEQKEKYAGIMLDCITIMITNLMFEIMGNNPVETVDYSAVEKEIKKQMEQLVEGINNTKAEVVLVTNELGSGLVPENKLSREFRDIAGRMNQYLAKNADDVYLCVSGIPVKIK